MLAKSTLFSFLLLVLLVSLVSARVNIVDEYYDDDEEPDRYWEFFPRFRAVFWPNGTASPSQWGGHCFSSVSGSLLTVSAPNVSVSLSTSSKHALLCDTDTFLLASRHSWHLLELPASPGHASLNFTWKNDAERLDIHLHGLQVFLIRDGIVGTVRDIIATLGLFLPGPQAVEDNLKLMQDHMNVTVASRNASAVAEVEEREIGSGDQIAIFKVVANDMLIMLGTGSHTGHHAAFLWIDHQLYVTESCDSSCVGNVTGIQKTLWKDWKERAIARNFSASWLPLGPSARASFNETAAVEWFKSVEGLPYGSHNFFFGWVDTPNANFPSPLSMEFVIVALPIFDRILPDLIQDWIIDGLNFRLQANWTTIEEVYADCEAKRIPVAKLFTIPEQDSWIYPDGPSMVCNVFWTEMLKAAGVFEGVELQGTEFTPKDSYQIAVFKDHWKQPSSCSSANPSSSQPFCQLFGPYVMELPGYNTIVPYNDMNESCPSLPTQYLRTPGC
eukprot:TRINITY_DN4071_c0_g1_i1.p1 TRINITY_DN4071_c0_g1~~TRINITY_DN4071_c0_g1_i1.p1  ORF type:complete len:509 (-),score=167.09 TRINITY_DN4071_c0_g1_i1:77-1576(-)